MPEDDVGSHEVDSREPARWVDLNRASMSALQVVLDTATESTNRRWEVEPYAICYPPHENKVDLAATVHTELLTSELQSRAGENRNLTGHIIAYHPDATRVGWIFFGRHRDRGPGVLASELNEMIRVANEKIEIVGGSRLIPERQGS